jgi:hypothetical protein
MKRPYQTRAHVSAGKPINQTLTETGQKLSLELFEIQGVFNEAVESFRNRHESHRNDMILSILYSIRSEMWPLHSAVSKLEETKDVKRCVLEFAEAWGFIIGSLEAHIDDTCESDELFHLVEIKKKVQEMATLFEARASELLGEPVSLATADALWPREALDLKLSGVGR